jgi:hypothetical protein
MIAHFTDSCQNECKHELNPTPIYANVSKLMMPFEQEWNMWFHKGMALGATSDTAMTASQLDEMLALVHSIANAIIVGTDHHAPLGLVQRSNQPPHGSLVCILTKLFSLDGYLSWLSRYLREFTKKSHYTNMPLLASSGIISVANLWHNVGGTKLWSPAVTTFGQVHCAWLRVPKCNGDSDAF